MATIKRVETMISMHQMDDEDDPKANTVARVVRARRPLPLLTYAKHRQECEPKRVRSFGSFDDLRVPDISANSQGCVNMDAYANDGGFSDDGSLSTSCAATFGVNDGCGGSDGGGSDAGGGGGGGGGSQSGYVQDVSPFDRILLAAWEDRFAAGLFRYDVTACDTKIIPGRIGFVAQYNEGRATKKRPTEFKVDQVCQEFDAGKFNFTKADKAEILFRFSPGGVGQTRSEYVASAPIEYADADRVRGESDAPTVVFINVSPIEYGHVLLTPRVTDCLPQRISKDALLPALFMAAESRNPYFRVGYNSLGAYATINHLHFQAYYLMEAFPIERAPTRALGLHVHAEGGALSSGVVVKNVVDYPARCLCFERADPSRGSDGFESLAAALAVCCERLQARDVPFNLLVADHGARVFLIPNQFSQRAAKGALPADVVATGVNPAVFEISGHLLYKQREDFETCDEASATRLLSCASLSEEDYDAACADVLALLDAAETGGADDASATSSPRGGLGLGLGGGRVSPLDDGWGGVGRGGSIPPSSEYANDVAMTVPGRPRTMTTTTTTTTTSPGGSGIGMDAAKRRSAAESPTHPPLVGSSDDEAVVPSVSD